MKNEKNTRSRAHPFSPEEAKLLWDQADSYIFSKTPESDKKLKAIPYRVRSLAKSFSISPEVKQAPSAKSKSKDFTFSGIRQE